MYMVVASKMGIEATFVNTVSNLQGRFLRSVVRVVEDNWTYVCARFGRTDVDFCPGEWWAMMRLSLRSGTRMLMG